MSQMDPGLIAFLLGVGIGFIEDEYIVLPALRMRVSRRGPSLR